MEGGNQLVPELPCIFLIICKTKQNKANGSHINIKFIIHIHRYVSQFSPPWQYLLRKVISKAVSSYILSALNRQIKDTAMRKQDWSLTDVEGWSVNRFYQQKCPLTLNRVISPRKLNGFGSTDSHPFIIRDQSHGIKTAVRALLTSGALALLSGFSPSVSTESCFCKDFHGLLFKLFAYLQSAFLNIL